MHPVVQPSVVSLFAGIGGFDLGFSRAGCRTVATVEIDKNCRRLLSARWPDAVHLDDVRTAGRHNLPDCDIVTFGFPCQDLSIAGKRAGLEGKRSGLFYEAMRIIDELKPAWAVWENVPGLLSSDNGRDLARVLFRLGESGYFGCVRCIDAQWLGVAQRRRRLFGVFTRLDSGAERCAEVLSVGESLRGHPAPSREAGEGVTHDLAPCPTGGGRGVERAGESRGQDPVVAVPDICGCMSDGAHNGGGQMAVAFERRFVRTSGGQPSVNLQPCLRADANTGDGASCVAFDTTQITSPGNYSRPKQGDPCHPLASGAHPPCVAIQDVRGLDKKQNGRGYNGDGTAYTVDAMATQGVCVPDVAGTMPIRASGGGGGPGAGTDEAAAGYLIPTVAGTLKSCGGKTGGWSNSADHAAAGYMIPAVAGRLQERDAKGADSDHTLRAEVFDASEDGTGRVTPIIPAVAGCLSSGAHPGGCNGQDAHNDMLVPVAFDMTHGDDPARLTGDKTNTLQSCMGTGGNQVPCVAFERRFVRTSGGQPNDTGVHPCLRADTNTGDGAPCVAFSCKDNGAESAVQEVCRSADVQAQPAHAAMQVRRLTAREAERLQGFQWRCSPTDHEAWQDELGRWWSPDYTADFSDSVRYRMLGNAVCVNVAEWIAKRLVKEVRREQA